jgi:hypothetical protein
VAVTVNGDGSDYNGNSLRLKDLYDYNLVTGSFSLLVAESLYLNYMANKPDDRAKSRGQKGAKHSLMLSYKKRVR